MSKLIPKYQKGNYMQTSTGKVANFQLPEVEVTAKSPTGDAWKDRNLYKAYKGRRYISEGRQKAKPLALGLAGLTAAPALTGAGIGSLIQPLDVASVTLDPTDWMNWVPFGLTAASKANRFTPKRIRQGIYNNVMPGSYSASYAGNKRNEFKGAIKDIVSGNTTYDNPKWKTYMEKPELYTEFNWEDQPELATQLRMEAWKKSLGLPHKDKYLLRTGKVDKDGRDIVTYNLNEIPLHHQQNYINYLGDNPNKETPDLIGNTGGWVAASKKDGVYQLEDLWDIQPFQNPNREGVLPKFIKKRMANKIPTPDSPYPYKWEWKSWVPKGFINFDPTEIVGKGPFRNITKLKPTKLTKEQAIYKIPIEEAKNYMKKHDYELQTDLLPFEDMSPQEIEEVTKSIRNVVNKYIDNLPLEQIEPYRVKYYTDIELLNKYGLFIR